MTTKKSILLLLGISVLVYFKWLLPGIYTNSDWWYVTPRLLSQFFNVPLSWSILSGLGAVDLLLWRFPLNFLYGITGLMHLNSTIGDRIFDFWPTLILGNISVFLLAKRITKSNNGAFFASLFFNYNTYYFTATSNFILYTAGVWSVITIFAFMLLLEKKSFLAVIVTALSLFVTGIYDFRLAYLSVFILVGYFLFYFKFVEKVNWKTVIRPLFYSIIVFILFAIFNIYWLLPLIFSQKFASNIILQRGLFGNEFLNILYAITVFHPFWTGGAVAVFDPQSIFFYFWVFPVMAFLGLFLGRKNKNILFFGIIVFSGIFLTKQVGQPFSYVYVFLFQHLPGFSAFREASKFYYLILLGFSILIAEFIGWYELRINRKSFKRLFYIVLGLIILLNAKPFLMGELSLSKPYSIPKEYLKLQKFIFTQNDFFRTLWVPSYSRWGPSGYHHPIQVAVDLVNNDWRNYFIKGDELYLNNGGQLVINSLKKSFTKNLLSNSSIKYVILPLEDKKNDDDFFVFYGEKRSYYKQELNKISYLKKVDIGTKDISVYENPDYRPHIYLTSQKETVYKDVPYQKVSFIYVNPTKYIINLQHVSTSVYLNFSDSFNPNWDLRLGTFHWFETLYKKNYFLPVKHFANDAGLNSFYIDPGVICSGSSSCIRNPDGSYDMHFTLYFQPQSYLYSGLIVSGATLFVVLVALGYFGFREIKNYGKKN